VSSLTEVGKHPFHKGESQDPCQRGGGGVSVREGELLLRGPLASITGRWQLWVYREEWGLRVSPVSARSIVGRINITWGGLVVKITSLSKRQGGQRGKSKDLSQKLMSNSNPIKEGGWKEKDGGGLHSA